MSNVTIDPRVLALGSALNQGYTSLDAKHRLEQHARSRKAAARAAKRKANEMRRDAQWR